MASTLTLTRRRGSTLKALRAELAALAAEQQRQGVEQVRQGAVQAQQGAILADILRALERGPVARDRADVALFVTVAETIGDRRWTCGQLVAHSEVAPALRDALEGCDITNARELGQLCRRMEGLVRPGLWLERVGDSRDGVVWRVRVVSHEHRDE